MQRNPLHAAVSRGLIAALGRVDVQACCAVEPLTKHHACSVHGAVVFSGCRYRLKTAKNVTHALPQALWLERYAGQHICTGSLQTSTD